MSKSIVHSKTAMSRFSFLQKLLCVFRESKSAIFLAMSKLSCAFIQTYLHSYSYEVCTNFLWCIHFKYRYLRVVFVMKYPSNCYIQKLLDEYIGWKECKPLNLNFFATSAMFYNFAHKIVLKKQMVGCDVSCDWFWSTFELWTLASELRFIL